MRSISILNYAPTSPSPPSQPFPAVSAPSTESMRVSTSYSTPIPAPHTTPALCAYKSCRALPCGTHSTRHHPPTSVGAYSFTCARHFVYYTIRLEFATMTSKRTTYFSAETTLGFSTLARPQSVPTTRPTGSGSSALDRTTAASIASSPKPVLAR